MREYLNSPPDLEDDHLTAGRNLYIAFLEEAGPMGGLDLSPAIASLRGTLAIVPQLAQAIQQGQLEDVAACFGRIAAGEKDTFAALAEIAGVVT